MAVLDEVPAEYRVKSSDVVVNKTQLVGSGNFADVYKGTYIKSKGSKVEVAVKVIRPSPTLSPFSENDGPPAWLQEIRNEAMVMTLMNHEHIIRLYGFCDAENESPPFIVLEYCAGGSLDRYLSMEAIGVCEHVQYVKEVAAGMRFLERERIVHRDLASRNVLVAANGVLKISDFGLSRAPKVKQVQESTSAQIPVRWMAPETLKRNPQFDNKTDMWAFGVFVFEVFSRGKKPFRKRNVKWIATQTRRYRLPLVPARTPRLIKELIIFKCWSKPEQRLTFREMHALLVLLQQTLFPATKQLLLGVLEKKGLAAGAPDAPADRWRDCAFGVELGQAAEARAGPRADPPPAKTESRSVLAQLTAKVGVKTLAPSKVETITVHNAPTDVTSKLPTAPSATSYSTSQGSSEGPLGRKPSPQDKRRSKILPVSNEKRKTKPKNQV